MVVTAVPLSSPVTVRTDPRRPRQPMPASDGADYLETIPGFASLRNGGTNGDPVFRGMFGSRLRILTNGSEMLGACPNRMDAPTAYIAPELFDALTVTKGPQTVLWGPGASAATVRFERGPETFETPGTRLDASVMAGSHGRFDRRLDAAAGNAEGYVRVQGSASEADDYRDGDGRLVPSAWDKWNTDIALGWTPDEDTWLELAAGRGDGEARYAGRGMDGSRFLRETLGLRVEKRRLGEHWHKLEAQLDYAYADHVMDNFSLRRPAPMGMGMGGGMAMGGDRMARQLDRRTRSGRLASTWQWDDLTWVAGVDAQHEDHRGRRSAYTAGRYRAPDAFAWAPDETRTRVGVFGELTWYLGERDRLVAGARLDRHRVRDERDDSATAGETRRDTLPGGFLRVERDFAGLPATGYLGLGHVQRFPDYWELKPEQPGPEDSVNAFAGVRPERTTQLDVGVQYRGERLGAWASGYAGVVEDFILFDYASGGGRHPRVDNVRARIAGLELGADYALTPTLDAEASLAYAWGRNASDDEPLPQIPPLESRLSLSYARDALSLGVLWRLVAPQTRIAEHQGNVVGQDLGESAGFGVVSLHGAYRLDERATWSFGVDNLFDATYTEHLNLAGNAGFGFPADLERGINEPGRTVWARLDLHL